MTTEEMEDYIVSFVKAKSKLGTEFINNLDQIDLRIFYYLMDGFAQKCVREAMTNMNKVTLEHEGCNLGDDFVEDYIKEKFAVTSI